MFVLMFASICKVTFDFASRNHRCELNILSIWLRNFDFHIGFFVEPVFEIYNNSQKKKDPSKLTYSVEILYKIK